MIPELLLPTAFFAGFFGSGHCFAMCGPVVVLLEGTAAQAPVYGGLRRRLFYNSGRGFFYIVLGAAAGGLGLILTRLAGIETGLSILRFAASLLLAGIGLNLLFGLRALGFLEKSGAVLWRRLSPLARHVLPVTSPPRAMAAGFIWGALPCGLVYSGAALAATSGSSMTGALVMLAFWAGTLPALLLAGATAGTLSSWVNRPLLRRVAGFLMICIAVLALLLPYLGGDSGHGHHPSPQI